MENTKGIIVGYHPVLVLYGDWFIYDVWFTNKWHSLHWGAAGIATGFDMGRREMIRFYTVKGQWQPKHSN